MAVLHFNFVRASPRNIIHNHPIWNLIAFQLSFLVWVVVRHQTKICLMYRPSTDWIATNCSIVLGDTLWGKGFLFGWKRIEPGDYYKELIVMWIDLWYRLCQTITRRWINKRKLPYCSEVVLRNVADTIWSKQPMRGDDGTSIYMEMTTIWWGAHR